MIDVTTAQGLDALASALAARLRAEQADPFAVATVLVPRHATKAWLQLRLTRELGILANVRLGYLARVMQELLEPGQRLLGRDALQARALGVLFDEAWLARAECAPVRDYLRGAGGDVGAVERRAVQLAGALAAQLEDYLLHRPALLAAWEAGEQTLGDDAEQAGVEAWQAALWRELGVTGEGRAAGALDLRRLIAAVEAGAGEVPARLHVFGFTRLAPGYQALLVALARRGCAVQLYLQQACAPNAGGLLPQLWGRPGAEFLSGLGERCAQGAVELRVQAAPEQAGAGLLGRLQHRLARGGDEALELAPGERSLQVLAAPSLQREVEAVAGAIWERVEGAEPGLRFDEVGVAVVDPAWDVYRGRIDAVFGQASRLPTSLLERPPGEASRVVEAVELLLGLPLADFRRDDALRFLVHPNVQAGVEDADPQEWLSWCQELKVFHGADAADHAGTYLTRDLYSFDQAGQRLALGTFLAGGADGQGPPVVTLEGQSYLPAALAPGQQASAARFQLLLRSLIADVRFAQRARLTLGEWSRFFTALVRAYVVAAGADEQVYGRVLGKLARMAEWEQAEEAEPASAGAAGKGGRRQAPPLRGSGEQEAAGADAERGLPTQARRYGVQAAADLARAAIQGVEPGRGRSLTGGVIVGPLRSLAGLPFRVLFVLGLGERQFPAQPRRDLLDLRQAARQAGDVSPPERDRFAFLNALGGAQEALVLSYVQRDEQTGERLAPSSLLHQLRAGLGAVTPAQFAALEVEVPLRRFAAASFPPPLGRGPGALPEALPGSRREAQARALRESLAEALGPGAALPEPQGLIARLQPDARARLAPLVELDPLGDAQALAADTAPLPLKLAALADFLASPLQAWAKHRLGLRGLDEDDPLSAADEPFASSALDATVLLREVFFAALGAVPAGQALETADLAQAYDAARLRYELAGRLPTGVFLQVERARHLSLLEAWLANVTRHPGDDALRGLASYSFGQAPRGVPGAVLAGPLELEVELEGAPRLVQLHGATQRVLPGCAGSLQLALGGQRAVHYLRGFLDHVVLAAAGHACAHEAFQVLVSPGRLAWLEHPKNLRAFRPFAADDARAYLRALIEDFLGGGHGYLFPVEAVQPYLWAWHEQGAQPADSLAEAIEALCRDAFRTHSGKHGPLAQLGRYRAPARAEDLAWARFGPYVRRRCEGELSL